jgi:hypothetical protein
MTLYEMSAAARQLYELLENGEIDEQTVLDTMESIGASEKLESYVYVQKELEAEIEAFKAEIDRMTERKKSLENQVERLKNAQIAFMQASGQKSANAGTFKLTVRENKSVEIMDETAIPSEYFTEIPASTRPDKKAMLAALKAGTEIEGAKLKISYSVTAK